jgi:predicted RNA binding protein YcfA (HicA-like mRNA interferase family)
VIVHDVKVREVIRLLEVDGWWHIRTTGSHRQFRHPVKPGTVTVAGSLGTNVPIGTLRSILKRAGLKRG